LATTTSADANDGPDARRSALRTQAMTGTDAAHK
jgi:hypothetical protein